MDGVPDTMGTPPADAALALSGEFGSDGTGSTLMFAVGIFGSNFAVLPHLLQKRESSGRFAPQ